MNHKLALNVKELSQHLGIGLNVAYELTKQPGFPAIRIGKKRIVIPITALNEWLNSNYKNQIK